MNEPWQVYYEELHERGEEIPDHEFNRDEDMREAAHEAYQATVDRLVNQLDYDEEEALTLGKAFGRAVDGWIKDGTYDWDELRESLERNQENAEGVGTL